MLQSIRPIIRRPTPPHEALAALGDIDPLHARLFAMRGLTGAEQLVLANRGRGLFNLIARNGVAHLYSFCFLFF